MDIILPTGSAFIEGLKAENQLEPVNVQIALFVKYHSVDGDGKTQLKELEKGIRNTDFKK